uniref:Prolyl 4-hydroxylase alpha subunit domain-containing protein n=1 Tax=Pseudo-nitzschia australis TaxID=44445 RepID=A0A7S4ALX4_9STRA|mmetsp:Transcript_19207/g.39514  ORF Transcript_19207/g.39514 Transcript_19207/m.39514 type:complete len:836 (-) Transcript_19207:1336-3843(-)
MRILAATVLLLGASTHVRVRVHVHAQMGGYGQRNYRHNERPEEPPEILTKEEIGNRGRFWKHNLLEENLVHEGVNHYHSIKNCIRERLPEEEFSQLKTINNRAVRKIGRTIEDPHNENIPMLVAVENAMHPTHVKAVQTLASCIRTFLPHLYESRAMYQEMNLDEDDGSGGNCPTHLAPLVGLFLPEVVEEMEATLEVAYQGIPGWQSMVEEDQADTYLIREKKMYPPNEVGIRASEHLTYSDFPRLAEHHDGDTVYTMNFAFSAPEDYKGGDFFILSTDQDEQNEFRDSIKPNQYDALVFLGGRYLHGVNEILGGHREMFSTELWAYPDTPFGSSLWSNYPANMEDYVNRCNEQQEQTNSDKCTLPYDLSTPFADSREDVRQKYEGGGTHQDDDYDHDDYDNNDHDDDDEDEGIQYDYDRKEVDAHGNRLPPPLPGINRQKDNELRPNRTRPNSLKMKRVVFDDGYGNEVELDDFYDDAAEPDFLVPKTLDVAEIQPIRWREDLSPVDGPDGESFVIGFPPELHEEFKKYVAASGMMKVAHQILYKEDELQPEEQRIYTLDDGEKWTAMVQGSWDTDMVWLDPGDESCFESLLGVLRRGGFDKVLEKVGKTFDLDGLMVQGVGAIFLSEYTKTQNMHVDIPGSRGSFYNIIVPVHIPADDVAIFKISDKGDDYQGRIRLDPNVGVVLGGESRHGTGECNYRKREDFRLSFAVYVADINDDNIDMIASDSTSLWPTQGDQFFFRSQKGRLWTNDGKNSLARDKGRTPMNIRDSVPECATMDKVLCTKDVQGMRLKCPKTCELYMEDDAYYAKYFPNRTVEGQAGAPTCDAPTCQA